MMNVRRLATGYTTTLSADCTVCGDRYRTIVDNPDRAARAAVHHACGSGAVGPLWTLTLPPRPTKAT